MNPGFADLEAVKRIIRYLTGTTTKKSENLASAPVEVVGYSDADWSGDVDDRKSMTGYVFLMQGDDMSLNVKK